MFISLKNSVAATSICWYFKILIFSKSHRKFQIQLRSFQNCFFFHLRSDAFLLTHKFDEPFLPLCRTFQYKYFIWFYSVDRFLSQFNFDFVHWCARHRRRHCHSKHEKRHERIDANAFSPVSKQTTARMVNTDGWHSRAFGFAKHSKCHEFA